MTGPGQVGHAPIGRKLRRVERSGAARVSASSWTGSKRERAGAGGAPGWRGDSSDRSGVTAGLGAPVGPQALAHGGVASGQSRAGQGSCGMPGSRFEEHSWTRRTVNPPLLSDKGRTRRCRGRHRPGLAGVAFRESRLGTCWVSSGRPRSCRWHSEPIPMAKGPNGRWTRVPGEQLDPTRYRRVAGRPPPGRGRRGDGLLREEVGSPPYPPRSPRPRRHPGSAGMAPARTAVRGRRTGVAAHGCSGSGHPGQRGER